MRITRIALLVGLALAWTFSGCKKSGTDHPDGGSSATNGAGGSNGTSGTGGTSGTTGTSSGTTTGSINPGGWNPSPDAGDTGVGQTDAGYLVLNSSDIRVNFAWIAANANGFISKIDTDKTSPTYKHEVARYWAVIPVDGQGHQLPATQGLRPSLDPSPSRTVIDPEKNMWVANRAPSNNGQGSVTKIANLEADCIDRDGDHKIETSHDANNDGIIDMNDANEFITPDTRCPGQSGRWDDPKCYDECVLFTQPVGSQGSDVAGRAITVGPTAIESSSADVWVGIWRDSKVFRLDSRDGHIVNSGGLPVPAKTYGGVTDSKGRLWWTNTSGYIEMVDPLANNGMGKAYGPAINTGGCSAYGIAVDDKDRIWNAGIGALNCAVRFDPVEPAGLPDGGLNGSFHNFHFDSALGSETYGRGRGISADNQGIVWMSGHCSIADDSCYGDTSVQIGKLVGIYADDGGLYTFPGTGKHVVDFTNLGTNAIGVGLDSDNNIWINTYGPGKPNAVLPGDPTGQNYGKAVVVDRNTGAVQSTWSIANSLYTYSDFTGYANAHFTSPHGTYHRVFAGCTTGGTVWSNLSWTADVPTGTALHFTVRVADDPSQFGAAEVFGPFNQTSSGTASPVNLATAVGSNHTVGVPQKHYLQLTIDLDSTIRGATPTLKSLNVGWACAFNPK